MIGWFGTAMLCYVTPKEHLGLPEPRRREGGRHRLQDRGARGRSRARAPGARAIRDDALSKRALRVPTGSDQFNLSLDPETARSFHDETLPQEALEGGAVLLDVRAQFCSMSITQDVRRLAERTAGLEAKAAGYSAKAAVAST